jgi:uncharacterized protein YggE
MNEKTKNYLGWVLIIAIALVTLAVWRGVGAYTHAVNAASFTVSGEGHTVIVPDVAEFSFGVITEGGADITKLQTDNTTKVNKAIDFVKSKGIAAKDIQTQNYSLNPRYQSSYCGPRLGMTDTVCPPASIVGYTIEQTVAVKIRQDNFAKIGEVLTGLVGAGANNVSQLQFTLDDPAAAESAARADAIEQAQTKAKTVAKAAGVRLGQLLSIDESGYYPMYKRESLQYAVANDAAGAMPPAPAIEPGSQEVNVTVSLRYEIK